MQIELIVFRPESSYEKKRQDKKNNGQMEREKIRRQPKPTLKTMDGKK